MALNKVYKYVCSYLMLIIINCKYPYLETIPTVLNKIDNKIKHEFEGRARIV